MDRQFVLYFVVPSVLGALIIIAGVIFFLVASRSRKKLGEVDISDWSTTGGKIISIKLDEREEKDQKSGSSMIINYEPVVDFVYAVNDVEYHGHNVFWHGVLPGSSEQLDKKAAQEILDKHPVNSFVPVHYNPGNPSESALLPNIHRANYVRTAGWMVISFGILVCCFTTFMFAIIFLGIR